MTAETTLRIARHCSNVIAVKEASGNLDQIRAIITGAPEGFKVIRATMLPRLTLSKAEELASFRFWQCLSQTDERLGTRCVEG